MKTKWTNAHLALLGGVAAILVVISSVNVPAQQKLRGELNGVPGTLLWSEDDPDMVLPGAAPTTIDILGDIVGVPAPTVGFGIEEVSDLAPTTTTPGRRIPMQLSVDAYAIPVSGVTRPETYEMDITSTPRGLVWSSFDCRMHFRRGEHFSSHRQEGLCVPDDFTENVQLSISNDWGDWTCMDLDAFERYERLAAIIPVAELPSTAMYLLPGLATVRARTITVPYGAGTRVHCYYTW